MFKTVLRNEEMKRKQLRLTEYTFEYLSERANEFIRPISKGVFFYEMVLMFTDAKDDEISEKEERINSRLESLTDTQFVRAVESIKGEMEDGSYPSKGTVGVDEEPSDDLTNIYIPVSVNDYLEEEWGQRYWRDHIDELLIDYIDSAYDSRYDRYKCKEEIADYIEHNEMPSHEVARAVVEGQHDFYRVQKAHSILDTENWWMRPDLGYGDIVDMVDERFDSNTSLDDKISASQQMLSKYASERNMDMGSKLASHLISDVFDVSSDYAKNEYLPEIDLPDYSGSDDGDENDSEDNNTTATEIADYTQVCQDAKDQLIELLEDERKTRIKNKIERMNACNVCLVDSDDIEELDEIYDQEKRNEKIREIIEKGSLSKCFEVVQQNHLHNEFIDNLKKELE